LSSLAANLATISSPTEWLAYRSPGPGRCPGARWEPPSPARIVGSHDGWVEAIALGILNGRPVAVTGGDDGTVRVWDLSDRRPLTTIALGDPINALAFLEPRCIVIETSRGFMLLELIPVWRASDSGD
jgi:WD40 repeat protein